MRKRLAVVGLFSALAITGMMALTLTSNDTTPVRGKALQLSCATSLDFANETIFWFGPPLQNENRPSCFFDNGDYGYVCSGNTSSYSFTADRKGAYAYLNSLRRENDSGTWRCKYINENAAIEIEVYTIPSGLSITQNPDQNVDLSETSVALQCKTANCTYPMPTIKWIFKDQATLSETVYAQVNATGGTQETCNSLERVYTSNLQLEQYTTYYDNSDKTGTFDCRIEYPDTTKNINSSSSHTVRFAVPVRNIALDAPRDIITFHNGTNTTLRCTAGPSRPQPVITWWLESSNVTNLSITWITKNGSLFSASSELHLILYKTNQGNRVYCAARVPGLTNVTESVKPKVNVWYQPSIPSVQTVQANNFPWLENQTGTLQCVMADPGNPTASVKWTSSRGAMDAAGNLVFSNLSAIDHRQPVYCQVQNGFTDIKGLVVQSSTTILNVEYRPSVSINPSVQPLRIKEGSTLTVTCNASGNPLPMVQWKNMNPPSNTLLIPNILRSNTGSYTCVASNKSTNYNKVVLQREESRTVIVEYAPDVIVNIPESTVVGFTAVVKCTAQGEPSQYTFHPWIHRVGQTVIRRLNGEKKDNTSILTLPNISIQDMGSYICTVDNSIIGLDGQLNQTSENSVYIQGPPVISETYSSFTGEIGKPEIIEIPFYSNSSQITIEFRRNSDLFVMTNTSDVSVYITPSNITLTFYTKTVMIPGHMAVLSYTNVTNKMFDNYTFHLSNENGNVTKVFEFISSGPPFAPKIFSFSHIDEGFLVFKMKKGFNGGHEQTFVVGYKPSGNLEANWSTVLRINETNLDQSSKNGVYYINIPKIQDGQQYIFRVYAENVKGKSSAIEAVYSDIKPEALDRNPQVPAIIGGVIGAAVLVIAIAVVVLFVKRRSQQTKMKAFDGQVTESTEERHQDSELKLNPVYDSSNPVVPVYAAVTKSKKPIGQNDDSNVYAQVDKSKVNKSKVPPKGKTGKVSKALKEKPVKSSKAAQKGKPVKSSRGDIYENSPLPLKNPEEFVYDNAGLVATDPNESVYENPGPSASKGHLAEKDGLQYAVLKLGPPTTKGGKPVIHGLENRTEYAEIAFGKREEPLPDSDEEKKDGAK